MYADRVVAMLVFKDGGLEGGFLDARVWDANKTVIEASIIPPRL